MYVWGNVADSEFHISGRESESRYRICRTQTDRPVFTMDRQWNSLALLRNIRLPLLLFLSTAFWKVLWGILVCHNVTDYELVIFECIMGIFIENKDGFVFTCVWTCVFPAMHRSILNHDEGREHTWTIYNYI